jgi:PLP dependent protein
VRARLDELRERIAAANRDPDTVRVVGVTKTFGPEVVRAAAAAGITVVGENYVDELETKRATLGEIALRWHFLGALQTNKIARAARAADVLCAVARVVELERLARARPGATLYVEVDFTGLATRHGATPALVADLVARGRDLGLDVAGLMTVAPPDPTGAREAFLATARLADRLALAERSMGMSDDLELALAAGSTEVRVGRGLFGARSAATPLA